MGGLKEAPLGFPDKKSKKGQYHHGRQKRVERLHHTLMTCLKIITV
jgi:hypothetical protein